MRFPFPVLKAQEAAAMIKHGQTVGFSAFTPAGSAKAIPRAIAELAKTEHTAGRPYQIRVLTGASGGESLDGALASANAISFRAPWQADKTLRALINSRQVPYLDMHLSTVQQALRCGFLGPIPIGRHVAEFLSADMRAGRIPKRFVPLQSGIGGIANAVFKAMGEMPEIPPFEMYSEVLQDGVIELIQAGRCTFASGTSLTVTPKILDQITDKMAFFRHHLVLRPQEISNSPEIIRRLGVISINTALEVDLFGNVNSTHVMGTHLMNGIGGSGDFTRNAYISIFTCPSVQKNGKISTIVPRVTHLDHSEHSVHLLKKADQFQSAARRYFPGSTILQIYPA